MAKKLCKQSEKIETFFQILKNCEKLLKTEQKIPKSE